MFTLYIKMFIILMIVYDIIKLFDRPPVCCQYFQVNKIFNSCSGKKPRYLKSKDYNY